MSQMWQLIAATLTRGVVIKMLKLAIYQAFYYVLMFQVAAKCVVLNTGFLIIAIYYQQIIKIILLMRSLGLKCHNAYYTIRFLRLICCSGRYLKERTDDLLLFMIRYFYRKKIFLAKFMLPVRFCPISVI